MPAQTYDEFVASLCLLREVGGEPFTVKVAVAAVIVNRMRDLMRRWPTKLASVVLQKGQFSSIYPPYKATEDPAKVLIRRSDLINSIKFPIEGTPDWASFLDCQDALLTALAGTDPTGGANFYHDISIDTPASWSSYVSLKLIGRVRFFKG